ncbi:hypothetical protein P43SY_001616 [Pythium insidiosum]|uniref:PRKR-interacting protein 1 n=1 Tax=Pythium insidiosum TaxID=114742 RepID=A0AAD5Q854_PYTIN|nr:hypothetical protein P43SY_001616 [Pythium insidiosum]
MGRYTTVQTYTDQDSKVAALSYETAAVTEGAAASGDVGAMAVKRGVSDSDDKFHFNRVDNVSGSSAGAGSGEFHMYRAARRREMERVERMEKEHAARQAQDEFEAKRLQKKEEFEARANKRADKRRRRKERAKARSLNVNGDDDDDDNDKEEKSTASDDPSEKASKRQKTDVPLPETPGGVPEIPNDGSFLERMLAQQKQQSTDGSRKQ